MKKIIIKILLVLFFLVPSCGLLYLSTDSFFVVSGSDAGIPIFSASTDFKVGSAILSILLLVFALTRQGWKYLVGALLLSTLLLGLASHSVVLNHRRAMLEDQWFLYSFDVIKYDKVEGLGIDWVIKSVPLGFSITSKKDDSSVFIFTGPPPWKTPFESLLKRNYDRAIGFLGFM
ncbi:hypothetical protein [Motiliproteus sp. MSK22-1]|uniref:hypothetical protein n=1 Tax=Motiliproteus sp. MSK22-1 TaxID=1897630 RepID=UPI000975E9E0|nr:hypothetical protein [Motiliproteus sp. MSK22-1]OMH39041.1 hypothetical protein BGP75_04820 [Motiliproteus sp. MSK22-1]